MRTAQIKIKIKSLVLERELIRADEERLLRRSNRAEHRGATHAAERLRAARRSLAHHHVELGEEIRATLIALAFLRGRAYADVEAVARNPPPLGRAGQIAEKFGGRRWTKAAWSTWNEAACAHATGFEAELERRELVRRDRAAVRLAARAQARREAAG